MRRVALLVALLIASTGVAVADPTPAPAPRERVPRPKRTITTHLDPIIIYRGVAVDGTMIPRPAPGQTLPATPAPKCKTDRRGAVHCVISS